MTPVQLGVHLVIFEIGKGNKIMISLFNFLIGIVTKSTWLAYIFLVVSLTSFIIQTKCFFIHISFSFKSFWAKQEVRHSVL